MSKYDLKNKVEVTKDFLENLITNSWLEVENLQNQINNLDTDSKIGVNTAQILKNLLTSQYVFIGCLENLITEFETTHLSSVTKPDKTTFETKYDEDVLISSDLSTPQDNEFQDAAEMNLASETGISKEGPHFEPFEYFVDFDDPIGEPLSDKDLYQ